MMKPITTKFALTLVCVFAIGCGGGGGSDRSGGDKKDYAVKILEIDAISVENGEKAKVTGLPLQGSSVAP